MNLKTIGNVYIVCGLIAIIEMVSSLLFHKISINPIALMLMAGIGLRAERKSSINFAYVLSCASIFIAAVVAIASIIGQVRPFDLSEQMKLVVRAAGFIISVSIGALFIYINRRLAFYKKVGGQ